MRTFCIHCGAANDADSPSCYGCGRLLIPAGATASPPAPSSPSRDQGLVPWRVPQIAPTPWLPARAALGAAGPVAVALPTQQHGSLYPLFPRFGDGDDHGMLRPYAAGLGLRSSALLIDGITGCIALSGLFILLGVVQLAFGMSNGVAGALAVLLLLAWWPLYFVGCWASGGRTLGYRVAGLRLVRSDGRMPTLGTCLIRFIGAVCSLTPLPLGYLWMVCDPNRQAWHDKLADTMVVREECAAVP